MLKKIPINDVILLFTGCLALAVSSVGLFFPTIYTNLVSSALLPGAASQDITTIISSILLIFLTLSSYKSEIKIRIIILGILGYFFYGYGIYVIEQMYNMLYLFYVTIFTLSFWELIVLISKISSSIYKDISFSNRFIKYVSIGGSLLSPVVFIPLWVISLIPLMQTGNKIESLYSVYILDLCFIMPAFLLMALLTFKENSLGFLLSPAMFILGGILIFSLALGEILKPYFYLPINVSGFLQSLLLSLGFLFLTFLHLKNLTIKKSLDRN